MTHDEFNAFCRTLPATNYVMQWRGSHVWKVDSKVFAIGMRADGEPAFTFKVSEMSYQLLRAQPGLRPAPYFATRGMKWIQHYVAPGLADADLQDYLRRSHQIVSLGLTKKKQAALGLNQP